MSSVVFLHGGGDGTEARSATFGRFVQATNPSPSRPLALIVAEEVEADRQTSVHAYRAIFQTAGTPADCLVALEVSPTEPLTTQRLDAVHPSGLFVCGGLTPYYHQALCSEATWIDYLNAHQIPYGGTSAGAAIAAQYAILGGWQAQHNGQHRPMLFHGASEGLTDLTVQPGLGLVPFAVDVHASQSGTLLRLIHAVDLEMAPAGWAIDEDTLLEVTDRRLYLHGRGHAYYVQRAPAGGTMVRIYAAPVEIPTAD